MTTVYFPPGDGSEDAETRHAADVSALEAEIDARVYRLYGLTAAEIKIVEGESEA